MRGTSRTVPWSWYVDPDVLRREQETVFRRAWQYVGHAGELAEPGDFVSAWSGDVPLVVVCDEERRLRAFVNVCRHRGHVVADGSGRRRTLQCPYHAWTYALDGTLRAAPRLDRESGLLHEELSLMPARVEARGPLVFAAPAAAPALADVLGDLEHRLGVDLGGLVFHSRVPFAIAANWKVVVENYLECYHCRVAHPGFSAAVDVDPSSYLLEPGEWTSTQVGAGRDGNGTGHFHFVWPATRLNVFPGPPNLSVGAARPDGPGRTTGFFDYFFAPDVPAEWPEQLLAFDAEVGEEDRPLVESVQRGVQSGLVSEGRLLLPSEELIAHFQELVRRALAADDT